MKGLTKPYREYIEAMPNLGEYEVAPEKDEEAMESQVEMMAPALVDIAERAMEEKPDMIVFLDKSARIFATPFMRYLSKDMQGDKEPKDRYWPLVTL